MDEQSVAPEERTTALDNFVFVDKKDFVEYIHSVKLQSEFHKQIIIAARGRAISLAVDVAQICVRKKLTGWKVKNVETGTDFLDKAKTMRNPEGAVSFIEIIIEKVVRE